MYIVVALPLHWTRLRNYYYYYYYYYCREVSAGGYSIKENVIIKINLIIVTIIIIYYPLPRTFDITARHPTAKGLYDFHVSFFIKLCTVLWDVYIYIYIFRHIIYCCFFCGFFRLITALWYYFIPRTTSTRHVRRALQTNDTARTILLLQISSKEPHKSRRYTLKRSFDDVLYNDINVHINAYSSLSADNITL